MIILLVSELAQLVKNLPAMQETLFDSWARKTPWRRNRLPTSVVMGFPGGLDGKESTCNVGGLDLIPGSGRSLEEGMATHSSILAWRIAMDRKACRATVPGVVKSQTRLSDLSILSDTT